jgi:hypothetical protein
MKSALLLILLTGSLLWAQESPVTAPPAASELPKSTTSGPADPGALKARKLIDQMIAALGGDAWLNYKTLTTEGRSYVFFHGKPASAGIQFWRFNQYPDKERRELTKQRDVVYIYNGSKGYEKTYKGVSADEQKSVDEYIRRNRHSLEVVIRQWLNAPGTVLFYDGQSIADQQMVDVVSILNKDNDEVTIGIDIYTHLPINRRYSWRDADKYRIDDETIYGNYRKVQGIQTPYTITNKRDGEISGQSFLSRAAYNEDYPPDYFDATATYDRQHYNPKADKH